MEPGLGLGLSGECLVARSLPTGPSQAQPKAMMWAQHQQEGSWEDKLTGIFLMTCDLTVSLDRCTGTSVVVIKQLVPKG